MFNKHCASFPKLQNMLVHSNKRVFFKHLQNEIKKNKAFRKDHFYRNSMIIKIFYR